MQNNIDQKKKTRVLCYLDAPTCATGFGTVSRNILEGLYKTGRYDIDVLGINYWGEPHGFPYRIWPTGTNPQKDPYGRQKIMNMVPQMEFDILFVLQDTFILDFLPTLIPHLKLNRTAPFKSICYYPVDSVIKEQWAPNIDTIDHLVAYSEFGKSETLKQLPNREDITVIPHGVNTNEFFPIVDNEQLKTFKQSYFGDQADKFIITNLNRNQQRKDVPRTIVAFKEFRKHVPESILYLHMAIKDQGWDLAHVCGQLDFDAKKDVIFPENFGPNQGYPRDIVNAIYNSSDVIVSTTLGEGFGLAWIEAMAARVPVIMPRNTAIPEFIDEGKGYLVNSGTSPSLWTVLPNDNEVMRPLVDVDDMVEKMLQVYNNREEAKKKATNAYKWVTTEMDWQKHIASRWVALFDEVASNIMSTEDIIQKDGIIKTEEF